MGLAALLAGEVECPARATQPLMGQRAGEGRAGRRGRDAPAGDGGRRLADRIDPVPRVALQQQRDRAPALGGELQPPGRGEPGALALADHRAQAPVAQALLHDRQQLVVASRLDIEQAFGREPRLVEPGREQVAPPHHPQHRPPGARGDARHEQRRRRLVAVARRRRRDLVQRIEAQALARQPSVELGHAERQGGTPLVPVALDGAERLAQLCNRLGHGSVLWIGSSR